MLSSFLFFSGGVSRTVAHVVHYLNKNQHSEVQVPATMEQPVAEGVESTEDLVEDSKKWPQYLAASLGKI
jgi:hypothetical protein